MANNHNNNNLQEPQVRKHKPLLTKAQLSKAQELHLLTKVQQQWVRNRIHLVTKVQFKKYLRLNNGGVVDSNGDGNGN